MATAAQVLANRSNSKNSTGPSTPAGKAASSQNATRHGLSGTSFAILPDEDEAAFHQLVVSLAAEFEPETPSERFLIEQAAKARWKMTRIERLEAEALDRIVTDPGAAGDSPTARLLDAIGAGNNILDKLQRYAQAAERAYSKAIRELHQLRAAQLKNQHKAVDSFIKHYVYAPLPNEIEQYRAGKAATASAAAAQVAPKAPVQNEAKPGFTTDAYGLGNPALRL